MPLILGFVCRECGTRRRNTWRRSKSWCLLREWGRVYCSHSGNLPDLHSVSHKYQWLSWDACIHVLQDGFPITFTCRVVVGRPYTVVFRIRNCIARERSGDGVHRSRWRQYCRSLQRVSFIYMYYVVCFTLLIFVHVHERVYVFSKYSKLVEIYLNCTTWLWHVDLDILA